MIVKIYEGDNAFYATTDGVPIGQTLKHGETCNVLKVTPINEVIPFNEVDLFRQRSLCYIDGIVNNTQLYKGAKKVYKLIRPNCNYDLNKFVK